MQHLTLSCGEEERSVLDLDGELAVLGRVLLLDATRGGDEERHHQYGYQEWGWPLHHARNAIARRKSLRVAPPQDGKA